MNLKYLCLQGQQQQEHPRLKHILAIRDLIAGTSVIVMLLNSHSKISSYIILKTTVLPYQNRSRLESVHIHVVLLEREANTFIQLKYIAREYHRRIQVEFLGISADTLEMAKK